MITLREATPIHLRFAERVCGAAPGLNAIAVKKGAVVPMVVTRDVRVGDRIVIARGALAQASVERVLPTKVNERHRTHDPIFPGVSLQLEWVTTVTGDRALIRATRKGPAKAVDVYVELTDGGAEVRPSLISKGVFGFFWRAESAFTFAPGAPSLEKPEDVCIPSGSRMPAYLDGDLNLGTAKVAEAQATLPAPSADAIVYVFRLREKKKEADVSPSVVCNQIEIGPLAPQQMTITNLPPGNFSCHIGNQPAVEIGVTRGSEYYAQLHRSRGNKWVLWWFPPEEGEDLSAETQVIPAKGARMGLNSKRAFLICVASQISLSETASVQAA
jgi:hypothetical protein